MGYIPPILQACLLKVHNISSSNSRLRPIKLIGGRSAELNLRIVGWNPGKEATKTKPVGQDIAVCLPSDSLGIQLYSQMMTLGCPSYSDNKNLSWARWWRLNTVIYIHIYLRSRVSSLRNQASHILRWWPDSVVSKTSPPKRIPSWELTYPIPNHLDILDDFPFPKVVPWTDFTTC